MDLDRYCPNATESNITRTPDDIALEKVENILYGVLMPVLSALGIVGNILNLVVLTRPNLMKIITYTYFRAMAISDLLTMIMVIPFVTEITTGANSFSAYFLALFHAHFVLPCLNALVGSSVMSIVAVTFERWISICHPIQAKNIQSPLRAKIIIATGWAISFSLYFPYCFRKYVIGCVDPVSQQLEFRITENEVFINSAGYVTYGWIREVVLRLLPMALLAVLNLRIVVALRKVQSRRRKLKGKAVGTKKKELSVTELEFRDSRHSISSTPAAKAEYRRLQEERRLVLLLLGIVVMFFVCVTPAAILLILPIPDEQFDYGLNLFRAFANLLELVNYALNFYVYVGCSSDFRQTFVSVFCAKWPKHNRSVNGNAFERSVMTTKTAGGSRRNTVEMDQAEGSSTPLMRSRVGSQAAVNNNNLKVVSIVTTTQGDQEHLKVEAFV